jgi:hypothetical protein
VGVPVFRFTPTPDHSARIREYDTFDAIESELEAASLAAALRLESPVG